MKVLTHISSIEGVNHLFPPDQGWHYLAGARYSNEEGLVELNIGSVLIRICDIAELTFESFGDSGDYQWCYFHLNLRPLASTAVEELKPSTITEKLIEIGPNKYSPASSWDDPEERARLPKRARPVGRILHGSIVVFQAASAYSQSIHSSAALHNGISGQQFRDTVIDHMRRKLTAYS